MKKVNFSDFVSLGLICDLEILAYENNCILWARNHAYDKQLFLSNTYTKLFGRETLSLYKDPRSWSKAVDEQDGKLLYDELEKQRTIISPDYTAVFCIKLPDGQKRWLQDRSVQLPISTNDKVIIIGCALPISKREDLKNNQEQISEKLDFLITRYSQILSTNCQNSNIIIKNKEKLSKLSKREKQIFILFIQGKTIAEVGEEIHLSPRTIEGYLTRLKDKLCCDTKSELIMKAIENGWLNLNI